jgi:hypothetical protein
MNNNDPNADPQMEYNLDPDIPFIDLITTERLKLKDRKKKEAERKLLESEEKSIRD